MTSPDTLTWPWRIEQGEIETLTIPVLDGDDAAVTVTGWTVDAAVKTGPGGPVLYTWPAELAVAAGTTVTLTIPPAVSSAWVWRSAYYRVKVVDPGDATQVHRILQGPIVVDPD